MNGTSLAEASVRTLATVANPTWKVGGTADFNGDGDTDHLWRNQTTGSNVVWLMKKTTSTQAARIGISRGHRVEKSDPAPISTVTVKPISSGEMMRMGETTVWYMNSTNHTGDAEIGTFLPSAWPVDRQSG
ncbi:MAG: hypothetical protein MZV49_09155 [Rhodopseudomonas palustris]|nr:hypothetical protein [Rhodopseudomonas palustris]